MIIFIVVVLFVRLMIWQEKGDISLMKALGVSVPYIRNGYIKRTFIYIVSGVVIGIILGIFLGQEIAGMMLASLGAAGFKFLIDPVMAFVLVPLSAFIIAILGVRTGSLEVGSIDLRM